VPSELSSWRLRCLLAARQPIRAFARTLPPDEPDDLTRVTNHYLQRGLEVISGIGTASSRWINGQIEGETENVEQAMTAAAQTKTRQIAAADPATKRVIHTLLRAVAEEVKSLRLQAEKASQAARLCKARAQSARERSDDHAAHEAKEQGDALERMALSLMRAALALTFGMLPSQ
jgi:hypothetical protein